MKKRIIVMMMALACGAGTLCAQTDNRSDTTAPINGSNINKKLPRTVREMLDKKNINGMYLNRLPVYLRILILTRLLRLRRFSRRLVGWELILFLITSMQAGHDRCL